MTARKDVPAGTLDMLVLRVISRGPIHGCIDEDPLCQMWRLMRERCVGLSGIRRLQPSTPARTAGSPPALVIQAQGSVGLRGDAYGGPVGLAVYYLARGEIEQAVEWAGKAVEQRFPAIIPRLIRTFEPLLRRSAAWPGVLKRMNLVFAGHDSMQS